MQVKQIENILRAKSGVPQNQLCLVIPLSYRDSDSDNLQNVSSNSKFGDFIPAEELQPLNLFINLCDAKSTGCVLINLRIKGCFFSVLLFYQPYVLKFEKFDKSFGVGE